MVKHIDLTNFDLRALIRTGEIAFGGNLRLRIYVSLSCASGKRMKRANRNFFTTAPRRRKRLVFFLVGIA